MLVFVRPIKYWNSNNFKLYILIIQNFNCNKSSGWKDWLPPLIFLFPISRWIWRSLHGVELKWSECRWRSEDFISFLEFPVGFLLLFISLLIGLWNSQSCHINIDKTIRRHIKSSGLKIRYHLSCSYFLFHVEYEGRHTGLKWSECRWRSEDFHSIFAVPIGLFFFFSIFLFPYLDYEIPSRGI